MPGHASARSLRALTLALAATFSLTAGIAAAGNEAKGTIAYKARTTALKYAWLVKGPDSMDPKTTIRMLILSADDIGAKLAACKTMSCAGGEVTEGMTVDFGAGPRLNYWVAVNGQKVQYSGTARPEVFAAKANDAGRLAGKLAIDDAAAGGPKFDAEFDVTVLKTLTAAR
ncbi:MAG: hypothetical protein ABI886_17865 [Betaproteobacteria bacterium]